jgi:hypothetical protein
LAGIALKPGVAQQAVHLFQVCFLWLLHCDGNVLTVSSLYIKHSVRHEIGVEFSFLDCNLDLIHGTNCKPVGGCWPALFCSECMLLIQHD